MMHPKVVAATVLALVVKGRWAYHFFRNGYSVREANRASSDDIETLHDLGGECVATFKAVLLLDPSVTDVTKVATTLKATLSLFDRFPNMVKERIETTTELGRRMDEKAVLSFAYQFAASLMKAEEARTPTQKLEHLYNGLHYAAVANIPLRGNDLELIVPKLIEAHAKRRHVTDRIVGRSLKGLSSIGKQALSKTLAEHIVLKRMDVDPYAIAGLIYNDREPQAKSGSVARLLVKHFATT
jgi:hypothetical protein